MPGKVEGLKIPISEELERRALAQAVYAPEWWELSGLRREDFGSNKRQRIFDAIETLRARATNQRDVNLPNIRLEVERWWGKLSIPQQFTDELDEIMATRGKLTELELERMRELTVCRAVMSVSSQLEGAIQSGDLARVRELLDIAGDAVEKEDRETSFTAHQLAKRAFDNAMLPEDQNGWPDLGLSHLRAHLGRAWPGSLIVVGARPNVGKSGLAFTMADGAIQFGTKYGYISLEDEEGVAGPRVLAMKSGISARSIHRKLFSPADIPAMRGGVESTIDFPMCFEFAVGGDHRLVRQKIRKLCRLGCRHIGIDYLQVARYVSKQRVDRREAVGLMLSDWKQEAKHGNAALCVFSQLRRKDPKNKPKSVRAGNEHLRPELEELKESGDIEEKADVILLMWRENNKDETVVHCEIAKSKMGGVGYEFDLQRSVDGAGLLLEVQPRHDNQTRSFGF